MAGVPGSLSVEQTAWATPMKSVPRWGLCNRLLDWTAEIPERKAERRAGVSHSDSSRETLATFNPAGQGLSWAGP